MIYKHYHSHNIDLNIDNYSLEDLLSLFKIDSIDSVENLSHAKSIALKMHPDKSGLDKEYFLFFSKLIHNDPFGFDKSHPQ